MGGVVFCLLVLCMALSFAFLILWSLSLVFVLFPLHTIPQILGISGVVGVPLVCDMLMKWLGGGKCA